MKICSPNLFNFNYTFTWILTHFTQQSDLFFIDSDGFPAGPLAKWSFRQLFMEELEDIKRWKVCRFVWTNSTGEYDPTNGRYDGALGLLIDGKADIFSRPLDYGSLDPELVDYQKVPFVAGSISPLQLIKSVTNEEEVVVESLWSLFEFLVPSTEYLTLALGGCLLYWLVSSLFGRFKRPTSQLPSGRNLQTRIVTLFFVWFVFFVCELFEGCLNTASVVVRTDQLLYSKNQILETRKEFCFWEKGFEMDFVEQAPEHSLLHMIYEKRNKIDPCYFGANSQAGNILQKNLDEIFTLGPHYQLELLAKAAKNFLDREFYMPTDLELYQSNRPFVVSKRMGAKKRNYLEKFGIFHNEMGFSTKLLKAQLPDFVKANFGLKSDQGLSIYYDSLTSYIDSHTRITELPFDKLDYLFRIYFALLTVILIVNLAHYYYLKMEFNRIGIWLDDAKQIFSYLYICAKQKLVSMAEKLGTFKRQVALFLRASLNRNKVAVPP